MFKKIRMTLELFEARERWLLAGLFGLAVVMALVQTLSVASILPFMNLVSNPEVISENQILNWLFVEFGFESTRSFLIFAGVLVLALTAFSNGVAALTQWLMLRFAWHQEYQLAVRLLARYLDEPYTFFLSRNTSSLAKTMFVEVKEAVNGVVLQGMRTFAQAIVVVSIFVLLLLVDPVLALVSTLVLGGAYALLYTAVRREQGRLGRVRTAVNTDRFRTASEALGGIKESKILGRERSFLERFSPPAKEYSRVSAKNAIIIQMPRYGLETIAFGGILMIVLFILSTGQDFGQAVAVTSLYALAGYRLMPALQQVFGGMAKARFYWAALEDLHHDLKPAAETPEAAQDALDGDRPTRLPLEREIVLDGVTYQYPGTDVDVLRDIDLRIPRRWTVGLVGSTGSGKTTLVDILLGLLEPRSGEVRIDGVPLSGEIREAWCRNLGYVPQDIFMCDDTVSRNIAFGLPEQKIDQEAVERAARMAQIHDFVCSLPNGYETVVGERGVRISGGQRQRVGIARALYEDPEVLIMDEATSALDGITEDAVMDAIRTLSGRKTIVLVAHRITTLRNCDVIYLFSNGKLGDSGTYEELMVRNDEFRAMAKLSDPDGERRGEESTSWDSVSSIPG